VRSPNTEGDLVGRTVFLDTNGNSLLDVGEPQTKTDGGMTSGVIVVEGKVISGRACGSGGQNGCMGA